MAIYLFSLQSELDVSFSVSEIHLLSVFGVCSSSYCLHSTDCPSSQCRGSPILHLEWVAPFWHLSESIADVHMGHLFKSSVIKISLVPFKVRHRELAFRELSTWKVKFMGELSGLTNYYLKVSLWVYNEIDIQMIVVTAECYSCVLSQIAALFVRLFAVWSSFMKARSEFYFLYLWKEGKTWEENI